MAKKFDTFGLSGFSMIVSTIHFSSSSSIDTVMIGSGLQTSAGAQVKGQCDKIPFRLWADSAKKLFFSASQSQVALVTLKQFFGRIGTKPERVIVTLPLYLSASRSLYRSIILNLIINELIII